MPAQMYSCSQTTLHDIMSIVLQYMFVFKLWQATVDMMFFE